MSEPNFSHEPSHYVNSELAYLINKAGIHPSTVVGARFSMLSGDKIQGWRCEVRHKIPHSTEVKVSSFLVIEKEEKA